jgi:hypothetical protein
LSDFEYQQIVKTIADNPGLGLSMMSSKVNDFIRSRLDTLQKFSMLKDNPVYKASYDMTVGDLKRYLKSEDPFVQGVVVKLLDEGSYSDLIKSEPELLETYVTAKYSLRERLIKAGAEIVNGDGPISSWRLVGVTKSPEVYLLGSWLGLTDAMTYVPPPRPQPPPQPQTQTQSQSQPSTSTTKSSGKSQTQKTGGKSSDKSKEESKDTGGMR